MHQWILVRIMEKLNLKFIVKERKNTMGKNEVLEINQIKLDGALTILNLNAKMQSLESLVVQELEKAEYNSIVTMDNFKVMKESSLYLGKVAKDWTSNF